MKLPLIFITALTLALHISAQECPIIKAKSAKHFIGKEVIVTGKFIRGGNSSYAQFAWFYLGRDTAHKQIKVLIQGKQYSVRNTRPITDYDGKEVAIRGFVKENKEIYLEATDTLKLK